MHRQIKVTSIVKAGEENGKTVLRIVGRTDSELDSSLVKEIMIYAFTDKPNLVFGEYLVGNEVLLALVSEKHLVDDEALLVVDEEGTTIFFGEAECEAQIDGIFSHPVSQCLPQPIPPQEFYKEGGEPFPTYAHPYWYFFPKSFSEMDSDEAVFWDSETGDLPINPTITENGN